MGLWFAVFPTVQTLVAQLFAAVFVIGSYFLAQYVRVWRPRRLGQTPSAAPERCRRRSQASAAGRAVGTRPASRIGGCAAVARLRGQARLR